MHGWSPTTCARPPSLTHPTTGKWNYFPHFRRLTTRLPSLITLGKFQGDRRSAVADHRLLRQSLDSICSGLLQALKFGLLHPMPQVNEDKQLPAEENTVQNVSRICRHKYGNSACLRAIFRRTSDATSLPESFKSNNSPPLSNNTRRRMELPRVGMKYG